MEGYFKVSTYAKLCGIKKDTAWHRVLRGSVDSIIGKDGMRYVYFSKGEQEGYIPLRMYCKKHGIKPHSAIERIVRKRLGAPDIKKFSKAKNAKWYIREDYVWQECRSRKTIGMYMRKPDGYLTVDEWSKKNSMPSNTVRVYIRQGKIESIRVSGYVYIPKGFVYLSPRNKNKALNEKAI